jgi:hypothetical protein
MKERKKKMKEISRRENLRRRAGRWRSRSPCHPPPSSSSLFSLLLSLFLVCLLFFLICNTSISHIFIFFSNSQPLCWSRLSHRLSSPPKDIISWQPNDWTIGTVCQTYIVQPLFRALLWVHHCLICTMTFH